MTADGKVIDLDATDRAFATAMAAPEPAETPDYPAPRKKRDPDAPFGFDTDGKPKAPFGIGANGKPRQNQPGPGRGKTTAADKPRIQPAGKTASPAVVLRDYSAELSDSFDGLWTALAFLPPMQAQACILKANKGGMVSGLNLSAQHNPIVRRGVEYLVSDASWMVNAAMLIMPFALQSAALWFRPSALESMGTSRDALAAQTQRDFAEFVAQQQAALSELLAEKETQEAAV